MFISDSGGTFANMPEYLAVGNNNVTPCFFSFLNIFNRDQKKNPKSKINFDLNSAELTNLNLFFIDINTNITTFFSVFWLCLG